MFSFELSDQKCTYLEWKFFFSYENGKSFIKLMKQKSQTKSKSRIIANLFSSETLKGNVSPFEVKNPEGSCMRNSNIQKLR